jgi:hypothetical protein
MVMERTLPKIGEKRGVYHTPSKVFCNKFEEIYPKGEMQNLRARQEKSLMDMDISCLTISLPGLYFNCVSLHCLDLAVTFGNQMLNVFEDLGNVAGVTRDLKFILIHIITSL